jgi:hypothetical protein
MSKRDYVDGGKGVGYYGSTDVYEDGHKVGSEVYKTTLDGKTYADVLDKDGHKVDSHYT